MVLGITKIVPTDGWDESQNDELLVISQKEYANTSFVVNLAKDEGTCII